MQEKKHLSVHTNTTQAHAHTAHQPNAWDMFVGSNLLNVLILAIALVYLGNKFLPKMIDERKRQISKELEDAKQARIKAEKELENIKHKTENVLQEIEQMKDEAKKTALTIKKQIEDDTEKELSDLRLKIKKEISSSHEEAIQDIKKSASMTAIKLAEQALSKITSNQEIQKKLADDFISELDKPSKN